MVISETSVEYDKLNIIHWKFCRNNQTKCENSKYKQRLPYIKQNKYTHS